jgi:hypothetical protein
LLNGLVEKKILETDSMAHYRMKPDDREEKRKQWISPEIAKLLKEKSLDEKKDEPKPIEIDTPNLDDPAEQ